MKAPPNLKDPEAIEIFLAIAAAIQGRKREHVMAAITCATGRALNAIGVPPEAIMNECIDLYVIQVCTSYVDAYNEGIAP